MERFLRDGGRGTDSPADRKRRFGKFVGLGYDAMMTGGLMNFNYLNLVMAGFWFFLAAMILGRSLIFPANQPTPLDNFPPWIGLVALGGVFYNLFRWRMAGSRNRRSSSTRVNPLAVRRPREDESEPFVKNPDFDFIKLPENEGSPGHGDADQKPRE